MQNDGRWWDIYCDPFIEEIKGLNYAYFEIPYLNGHLSPPKTNNIYYYDYPLVFSRIMKRFSLVSFNAAEQKMLNKLTKTFSDEFCLNIDFKKIIRDDLSRRKSQYPFYYALIKKIKPRLAFVVVSYGKETFIEACKQLGVRVVELQHGVINPTHLGYSFPLNAKRTFPDYLLTWGKFWKENAMLPISNRQIFDVGYPFFEKEIAKYQRLPKRNQVIFISQGTIGKKIIEVCG